MRTNPKPTAAHCLSNHHQRRPNGPRAPSGAHRSGNAPFAGSISGPPPSAAEPERSARRHAHALAPAIAHLPPPRTTCTLLGIRDACPAASRLRIELGPPNARTMGSEGLRIATLTRASANAPSPATVSSIGQISSGSDKPRDRVDTARATPYVFEVLSRRGNGFSACQPARRSTHAWRGIDD